MKTDRYPTTKDLLGYFRDVTPESIQHIIEDLFERVMPFNGNKKAL